MIDLMIKDMKTIEPDALLPMDLAAGIFPLQINLVYAADAPPNIFGKIYADDARLWLHNDLARIVLLASLLCKRQNGCEFVLYDGLRTAQAQAAMAASDIVQANPHWMEAPRLLSPPGAGAHPRAMAIDIGLMGEDGALLDMGTVFDHLAENASPERNPAHRDYVHLEPEHAKNRAILDGAMQTAADLLDFPLYPLPQEWWDFRLPEDIYSAYAPLSDVDLPPEMRMVSGVKPIENPEKYQRQFKTLKEKLEVFA